MSAETGRAAVLTAYDEPLEVRELPLPDPEPGALLVRMVAATMCGSEVHLWRGEFSGAFPVELPVVPGHEGVGEVVAVGAGAELDSAGNAIGIGDRIVWEHASCGACYECSVLREPTLCPNRRIGFFSSCERFPYVAGTFAEHSYVWPRAGRLRVPDEVESAWASAGSCALRTVVTAFEKAGHIDYMHNVVVQGAGPLGLFAAALLGTQSPRRLIVVGGPDERLGLAEEWGADETVSIDRHPDPEERRERILELTDGRGPDLIFDMAGGKTAFGEGIAMAARGGRYVVVGSAGGPPQSVVAHYVTNRNLTVIGSLGASIDAYYKAMEFLRRARDRFDWDRLLSRAYGLDEVTTALERLAAGEEIKPVILPNG